MNSNPTVSPPPTNRTDQSSVVNGVGMGGDSDAGQPQPSSPAGASQVIPTPSADDYQAPSLKEQKELLGALKAREKGLEPVRYKEYHEAEVGKEVKDWIERLETAEESQLSQPVVDDFGQILLNNAAVRKPQIILPLKEEEVKTGLHHRVADSIRWLAEWCLRVIKIVGKRAVFNK